VSGLIDKGGDFNSAGLEVFDGVVCTVVAELELVGPCAECKGEELKSVQRIAWRLFLIGPSTGRMASLRMTGAGSRGPLLRNKPSAVHHCKPAIRGRRRSKILDLVGRIGNIAGQDKDAQPGP